MNLLPLGIDIEGVCFDDSARVNVFSPRVISNCPAAGESRYFRVFERKFSHAQIK